MENELRGYDNWKQNKPEAPEACERCEPAKDCGECDEGCECIDPVLCWACDPDNEPDPDRKHDERFD